MSEITSSLITKRFIQTKDRLPYCNDLFEVCGNNYIYIAHSWHIHDLKTVVEMVDDVEIAREAK